VYTRHGYDPPRFEPELSPPYLVGGPYNISVFCPTGNLCEPQTDADAVETLSRLDSLVPGQRHGHGRRVHVSEGKYNIVLHNTRVNIGMVLLIILSGLGCSENNKNKSNKLIYIRVVRVNSFYVLYLFKYILLIIGIYVEGKFVS